MEGEFSWEFGIFKEGVKRSDMEFKDLVHFRRNKKPTFCSSGENGLVTSSSDVCCCVLGQQNIKTAPFVCVFVISDRLMADPLRWRA